MSRPGEAFLFSPDNTAAAAIATRRDAGTAAHEPKLNLGAGTLHWGRQGLAGWEEGEANTQARSVTCRDTQPDVLHPASPSAAQL